MIVKILERLEAERKICLEESALISASCIQRIKEIVQEVAKEYGKDTNVPSNEWILCSERLPEKTMPCLVTVDAKNSMQSNPIIMWWIVKDDGQISMFSERKGHWKEQYYKVIAWQPLPAPYQKGEGK